MKKREKKAGPISKQLRATAFHEAGHAVAAFHLGIVVKRVSIVRGEDHNGLVSSSLPKGFDPDSVNLRNRGIVESNIIMCLAGPIAEKHFTGRYNHVGARQDYRTSIDLACLTCGSDKECERFVEWLWVRSENLLKHPRNQQAVKALAEVLLQRKAVSGRLARRVWKSVTKPKRINF